jgi:hypothetical protein
VLYTPDANYYGPDSFQYTIHDGRGGQATATVTVTVNPINDPPTAVDDWASTPEETPVGIPVLSNDVDIDGNIVTSTLTRTDPLYGAVSGPDPKTGVLTYTPGKDYNGDDHFTYRVCDDGTPLPSACRITRCNTGGPIAAHTTCGNGRTPAPPTRPLSPPQSRPGFPLR